MVLLCAAKKLTCGELFTYPSLISHRSVEWKLIGTLLCKRLFVIFLLPYYLSNQVYEWMVYYIWARLGNWQVNQSTENHYIAVSFKTTSHVAPPVDRSERTLVYLYISLAWWRLSSTVSKTMLVHARWLVHNDGIFKEKLIWPTCRCQVSIIVSDW